MSLKYRSFQTSQGTIEYVELDSTVEITGYRGRDVKVSVPDTIEDKTVTRVRKKAFLSAKTVRTLELPYTVTAIDDFAFAFCSNLKTIYLSEKTTDIGLSIFKDCDALEAIYVLTEKRRGVGGSEAEATQGTDGYDKREHDMAHLLASTIGILDAPFLLTPDQVYDPEWLAQFDKRVMSAMEIDDMEGYSKLLLCGEEDYGSDENKPDVYKSNRIKAKVRLCMLRLLNDYDLPCKNRDYLVKYLQCHKKGEMSEETWQVVLNEHGDDREYYDFLMDIDCVNKSNLPDMLIDMKDSHAEMKAYLLKQGEASKSENSFFDDLEL